MRYYFVDLENVSMGGFKGIDNLNKGDVIYLFHSANTAKCKPDWQIVQKLMDKKASLKPVYCEVGTPNSMDFQICAIVGYVLGKKGSKGNKFTIISRDTDFDRTISMMRGYDVDIDRFIDFNCKEKILKKTCPTADETVEAVHVEKRKPFTKKELMQVIAPSEYSNEMLSAINAGLVKTEGNDPTQIKIALDRYYRDVTKSNSIYSKIRPLI